MSEPVTKPAIEEVLSSIRRLVSETGHDEKGASVSEAPKRSHSRLVLTPALRVEPFDDPAEERIEKRKNGFDPASLEATVSVSDAPSEQHNGGTSDRLPLSQPSSRPSDNAPFAGVEREARGSGVEDRIAAKVLPIHKDVSDAEGDEQRADDVKESSSVAATGLQDAPWRDPNAKLYDAVVGLSSEPSGGNHSGDGVAAVAPDEPLSEAPTKKRPYPSQQSPKVAAVVRRIAELETALRDVQDRDDSADVNEDDIDAVPAIDPQVETLEWEDHVDSETSAWPGEPVTSNIETAEPVDPTRLTQQTVAEHEMNERSIAEHAIADQALQDLLKKPDHPDKMDQQSETSTTDFLDEGSLRDLVSEIVRQELQGPLGERITRNVRKLVRREIQRALAAEDLL